MQHGFNDDAVCRKCGYLLGGLDVGDDGCPCPECGRLVNPSKPRTFYTSRRRRFVRRRGPWILLALALLTAVPFFPRSSRTSTLTFTCKSCGQVCVTKRWEAMPPKWLGVRYPGIAWTSELTPAGHSGVSASSCESHLYSVQLQLDWPRGRGSGSGFPNPGEVVVIYESTPDGRYQPWAATPATAGRILRWMMSEKNPGVSMNTLAEDSPELRPG